jgi:hypothetical protein
VKAASPGDPDRGRRGRRPSTRCAGTSEGCAAPGRIWRHVAVPTACRAARPAGGHRRRGDDLPARTPHPSPRCSQRSRSRAAHHPLVRRRAARGTRGACAAVEGADSPGGIALVAGDRQQVYRKGIDVHFDLVGVATVLAEAQDGVNASTRPGIATTRRRGRTYPGPRGSSWRTPFRRSSRCGPRARRWWRRWPGPPSYRKPDRSS